MLFDGKKVYLSCGATDLRKNIDALSALVEESFKLDPFSDTLFVFCNRSRDILKLLQNSNTVLKTEGICPQLHKVRIFV